MLKSMPQIYLSKEERRQDIKQTDVCFDIIIKKTLKERQVLL